MGRREAMKHVFRKPGASAFVFGVSPNLLGEELSVTRNQELQDYSVDPGPAGAVWWRLC